LRALRVSQFHHDRAVKHRAMIRFPLMLMVALPLVCAADARETPAERGTFGDFTFDASRFAVEGEGRRFTIRSVRNDNDQRMVATVRDAPASECTIAKLQAEAADWRGDHTDQRPRTISREGFEIHLVRWVLGCRNARPPSVLACTAYRGRVYWFQALTVGCRGGPGFSGGLEGFLGSLAVAP
jgi:hypothetical protein